MSGADLPSKSHINRCGELVRGYVYDSLDVSTDQLNEALRVITDFRAAHAYPLAKVRLGLRSMVQTENATEVIGQRLKRIPRIIRKLQRTVDSPTGRTTLARLEDIGGVRAVFKDGAELDRVRRRIEKNWRSSFRRERDYIATPKDIGYRAVHYVVVRDGRAIEVQLRTRGQQQWAEAAEAADARLGSRGVNLKDADAPAVMLEYFRAAGELIYHREYGLAIPSELEDRFATARIAVVRDNYYSA
ncbi:RelA/SpoT domain-containing protein [Mycolicibacterium sp. OfavD-34-C]|uniref:RelA/SpoT domain-containing protein n=1 Tax=Mycolicibacterium sp. OfavD-34-C TaxID=2917746 RepID=UPI001EF51738|nr:RelA/SpoT domain-containing protein [Mycolicibacterium sp. OfavD-34-C]MCG7582385.1 RelA/SpoT domain-containing protein [Mycolicibacterium sp. OfavD-34-C]